MEQHLTKPECVETPPIVIDEDVDIHMRVIVIDHEIMDLHVPFANVQAMWQKNVLTVDHRKTARKKK
jgi:hypothetical protein